jgi:site-specific recombinase XerD
MLEKFVERRFVLERFRSGPVGPHIDGFAEALLKSGYAWQTGASCLRHAVHLGRWSAVQGIAIEAFDEDTINAFDVHLGSCECPYEHAGSHERAGVRVRVFLEYLREIGVAAPAPVAEQVEPRLLVEFREWMRRQRGSSDWTLRAYSRPVRGLIERLGEDPSQYSPQALRKAVLEMAAGHGTSKAEQVATATRMFLGFLAVTGRCSPYLADAIPRVAAWSQTTLPKHLPAEDVDKLIANCDSARPASRLRDRAILLLLARLGLRADDVMSLRLVDVDWTDASFRVCGKGRREARLPLPQDVGDAILAYLEHGRPRVRSGHVFLTVRAPWRPIGNNATIAGVVGRAIKRAGVEAPSRGSHLLRHSAATAMLRNGASLPSIGAILRHRTIETTTQYARVDGQLLGQVAQPWPEAATSMPGPDGASARNDRGDLDQLRKVAQPWPTEVPPC